MDDNRPPASSARAACDDVASAAAGVAFLERGGEMGRRMRAFDWAATALGPPQSWPQSLRTVVRILLDSRYAMWMLWGPDLTFFCNDAYLPTVGIRRDWVLGARSDKVWAEIWPDIGPRIAHVLETGEATWDQGLMLLLERSGYPEETYHTFSYSPVYDDAGSIAGMLCVVTEDTERRISERRIALLGAIGADLAATNSEADVFAGAARHLGGLPDLPCAVVFIQRAGTLQCALRAGFDDANGGAEDRSGDAHGVAGERIDDAPWPLADVLASGVEQTIELDARFGDLPRGPWPDAPRTALLLPIQQQGHAQPAGVFVACLNRYRPLDDAYRRFLRLLAAQIASAVANARSYAGERRRAEALAEIDRAKTAFFSNVSHEFRTPLTLMMGPLEDALRDDALASDVRDSLAVAHRNSVRLLKLVNSLLDFSRIEAGRLRARYVPTDIATLTAELASVFRSAIERAGVALHVDCVPVADVHVDRDMWEKIVFNLLSNALKHTHQGDIRVRVVPAGDMFELSICDTGIGIPADALPQVFDRFYRVPNARARTHEGSGIGLALVQEFVKLHGGTVRVASEVDVGTTFTVALPRNRAHLPDDATDAAAEPAGASGYAEAFVDEALSWQPDASPRTRPPRAPADADTVLLVDDNADMREYVRTLLSSRFHVRTAADGLEALREIERARPDLVLTDVMMPRLDGFGLLKALRDNAATRELPVIVLSARAGEEARIEGIDAGADDYLVKPFSARELHARVGNTLAMARARREYVLATRAGEARRLFLLDFADALHAAQSPEEVVAAALSGIGGELATACAGYVEVERDGTAFRVVAEWRADGAKGRAGERFPIDHFGEEEARRAGLPIVIADTRTHRRAEAWLAEGTGAVVTVPSVTAGRSPAALWVSMPGPRAWHGDEIALMREAAERVWAELGRARAESALRESEERFRAMADSSPLLVWVVDPHGRVVFANRACQEFFGRAPARLGPDGWRAYLHPDDADGYTSEVLAALAARRPFSVMGRVRRSDGVWRWVQSIGAPRFSEAGEFLGAVGSSPDVTELIEASDALRDADRRKDEFLATLAHELRNPLAPIRQAARLSRSPEASDAQRRWSQEVIERQVKHMALLLDDLLDVSRITRGKLELRRARVDLASVVAMALETAHPLIDDRRQTVIHDLPAAPIILDADSMRLAQVLANLLTNAAKYSEPGGIIELAAVREVDEIRIDVKDGGIGIEPTLLPRVFEMFSQMHGSLDRAEGGLGIGLALVKGLVELHGGRVEAHSAGLGHGAQFSVRLPLPPPGDAPEAPAGGGGHAEAPDMRHARILVADDNRDAASSLATLLMLDGHDVRVANDGARALVEAESFRPHIALLDIGMPMHNGYDVARAIRAAPWGRSMVLVAVTGWGQSEDKRRAKEAGFDHHFTKPLDLDVLGAFVTDALARQPAR
ncbi:MAG TPA: ATP-binding protein [Casimicrobiaceae bacterium]|nr:ATP-binding protein [Casimicrobiaceae bacterium]